MWRLTDEPAPDALRHDGFLGGRLRIWQPVRGYRAGVDPVLLAASIPARAGETVLELGCGAGVAALCLMHRVPGLHVAGLEVQPDYAALARRNATEAGLALEVLDGDLRAMPPALKARRFDHVMMNPPFFDRARGTAATDAGRDTGRGEGARLAEWIAAGSRRLQPRGRLTLIHRAERLAEALGAMTDAGIGSFELVMLHPRQGRDATLILLAGLKSGRAGMRVAAPRLMHEGAVAGTDHDDYSPEIAAVLRLGAALDWSKS